MRKTKQIKDRTQGLFYLEQNTSKAFAIPILTASVL